MQNMLCEHLSFSQLKLVEYFPINSFQDNYYDYHQKNMTKLKKDHSDDKERVIREEREKMESFRHEKVDLAIMFCLNACVQK